MTISDAERLHPSRTLVLNGESKGTLPGTTYPINGASTNGSFASQHKYRSKTSGPVINGKPTTISLFEPPNLADPNLIRSIYTLVNDAFADSGVKYLGMPTSLQRLEYPEQFLEQVGSGEGTFTYLVQYAGTEQVIATASAHRYVAPVVTVEDERSRFERVRLPGASTDEYWELKLMAVEAQLQRQGLAGLLMRLCEDEVERLFRESGGSAQAKRLYFVLSTIREINWDFYERRGFGFDYETTHAPGFLGTLSGFTVVHMSKLLDGQ